MFFSESAEEVRAASLPSLALTDLFVSDDDEDVLVPDPSDDEGSLLGTIMSPSSVGVGVIALLMGEEDA